MCRPEFTVANPFDVLECAALSPSDYDAFSCTDDWKVHWEGFSRTHKSSETASCWEMEDYVRHTLGWRA